MATLDTSSITPTEPPRTVDQLLAQIGDLPRDRVLLRPAPGTATVGDVVRLLDVHERICELVGGTLIEKTMGARESALAMFVGSLILGYCTPRKLGVVTGADGTFQLVPGLVRVPDVAFVRRERLAEGKFPKDPVPALVPNLAIEILSTSNSSGEMKKKRKDYFAAGVELVWEINPETREVLVYRSETDTTRLRQGDVLSGESVLPGFTLALDDLFSDALFDL